MTKISNKTAYPKKTPVETDYFVGTDSENNGKTVHFKFEDVARLVYIEATKPFIFDGFIGITDGFEVGQQTFTLPDGAVCIKVSLSHEEQIPTTPNNIDLINRWSQTGNTVTITQSPVLNNYMIFEYIKT